MVEVGEGVDAVGLGVTLRVDGVEAGFPLFVFDVDGAFSGEQQSVTAVAGGHDAVEHVDAALDGLEEVLRGAHAHEVAGAVLGKDGIDDLDHLVHHLGGLAHGQAADGAAFGFLGGDVFGALLAEVLILAALDDGEECLVVPVEGFGLVEALQATVEPTMRKFH